MTQRNRWVLSLTASCIALLSIACTTDLTAVREWSKTSLEATQYSELVTTYANTPQRLKRYDPKKSLEITESWDAQIKLRQNQAEALKTILSAISDYMAALAILSSASTVDYSKDVGALNAGIQNLNAGISNETLGAVGSLVNAVLGTAAKAYQKRQVADIVERANGPLQTILRGELRNIISQDFRGDLSNEKTSIGGYFKDKLRVKEGAPPTSAAARVALEEWEELRLEENAKRTEAVDAYLTVLDKVAVGHQKLYDNRNELDAEKLIKDLFSLIVEIRKQIKILAAT